MLVKFHSSAAQDLTMLRDLAQYLLGIIGKRIGERGVITSEELPAAIVRLEAAVAPAVANGVNGDPVHAMQRRRVYPFLDLLREARRQHADVVWGF